jgi:hypothetical protein
MLVDQYSLTKNPLMVKLYNFKKLKSLDDDNKKIVLILKVFSNVHDIYLMVWHGFVFRTKSYRISFFFFLKSIKLLVIVSHVVDLIMVIIHVARFISMRMNFTYIRPVFGLSIQVMRESESSISISNKMTILLPIL